MGLLEVFRKLIELSRIEPDGDLKRRQLDWAKEVVSHLGEAALILQCLFEERGTEIGQFYCERRDIVAEQRWLAGVETFSTEVTGDVSMLISSVPFE